MRLIEFSSNREKSKRGLGICFFNWTSVRQRRGSRQTDELLCSGCFCCLTLRPRIRRPVASRTAFLGAVERILRFLGSGRERHGAWFSMALNDQHGAVYIFDIFPRWFLLLLLLLLLPSLLLTLLLLLLVLLLLPLLLRHGLLLLLPLLPFDSYRRFLLPTAGNPQVRRPPDAMLDFVGGGADRSFNCRDLGQETRWSFVAFLSFSRCSRRLGAGFTASVYRIFLHV